MGDGSHLERMGRELKCPICLSLFTSAVSLSCNHIFCNSCIVTSMKSDSTCPVCKVPYQRREIRPAAHMDNLVTIYRSMEIASGINILVTQNAPSTNSSDEKKTSEGDNGSAGQAIDKIFQDKAEIRKMSRGRRSKRSSIAVLKDPNPATVKPSFPAKKRVQVSENPLSETPMRWGKSADSLNANSKRRNENGELVLSPFFWLREDADVEKLSQLSEQDQDMEAHLLKAPSFSDIKDSEDEMPSKLMENEELQSKSIIGDFFDSEMFEWTQRPCSPELCWSPSKMQVEDTEESDKNPKKKLLGNTTTHIQKPSAEMSNLDIHSKMEKSNKQGRTLSKGSQEKHTKKVPDEVLEKCDGTDAKALFVAETSERNCYGLKIKKITNKRADKVSSNEDVICPSENKIDKVSVSELSLSVVRDGGEKASDFVTKSKIHDRQKSSISRTGNGLSRCSKRLKVLNDDVPRNEVMVSELSLSSLSTSEDVKASGQSRKTKIHDKQKSSMSRKCNGLLRCSKKLKVSIDNVSRNKLADDIKIQSEDSSGGILPTVSTAIHCAFCHSAKDSEATGPMIHYFNGKPVQAGFSGGRNIIHSHKNCAEWAPNVYFEHGTAINLESELARSRRIRCSLCGDKGAALGCFERSCRKSFHFPCVKVVQQCRWDTDSFVMLCPLHTSSKLPNENSGLQPKERRKCTPKGKSHSPQTKLLAEQNNISSCRRSSLGSAVKMILCCSALTVSERGIVSEFERFSGVSVLKKWDASVTHVIASIDENGACKRTLKVLMGILEGKWILSIEWIKACVKAAQHVDEEQYEIIYDSHGIKGGPRVGRLRLLNEQPKLFDGLMFYFTGEFVPSYLGYLRDLVIAAGGTVLHRKPIPHDQDALSSSSTFIIYSLELPDKCNPENKDMVFNRRRVDAEALSCSSGAKVASNLWVLNSIAACKLQSIADC